ncbi:MAG: regulatory protein RecX [Candidatus Limnocylindrales bacterium]
MPPGRRPKESFAERRARRAEIDDPAIVLDAALRFLESRARSVAEVHRRLTMAGYREDLVTAAIGRLGDLGMLDDAAFATQWVESRDRSKPRGERALQVELRQKGLDSVTIAGALEVRRGAARDAAAAALEADPEHEFGGSASGEAPSADEGAARRLIARHARALERVADPRARRQRAYALLSRSGFGPDVAASVAREFLEVSAADDDPDGGP